MSSSIKTRALKWINGPIDQESKNFLKKLLENDPKSLHEAFYTDLSFGTSGIRALMGVGSSKLNIYTIQRASQALANLLIKEQKKPQVVLCYDSRNNSYQFAKETAKVLAGNKIKALILQKLRPTPFLSFLVRQTHSSFGVMITASHNPKEYNGFKVYSEDGGEVAKEIEEKLVFELNALDECIEMPVCENESSYIEEIDPKLFDEEYIKAIKNYQLFKTLDEKEGSSLRIVYSSLHGTGSTLVPKTLKSFGFTSLDVVEEQIEPNGDFPTIICPNPEDVSSFALGAKLLKEKNGNLLLINDGDADRIGVAIPYKDSVRIFNGNEYAAMMAYFICHELHISKKLPKNGALITTFVTTDLIKKIATSFGLYCEEVPTGFKFVGQKIHEWELSKNGYTFIFGAEESYGSLFGTAVRDKDGVQAAALVAEIALHLKQENKTLIDLLFLIYKKYGLYRECQHSLLFQSGEKGTQDLTETMQKLRRLSFSKVASLKVLAKEDFLSRKEKIDMIVLHVEEEGKILIRPSGTEPKLRIHIGVKVDNFASLEEGIEIGEKKLKTILDSISSLLMS